MEITITRAQARMIGDLLPKDTPETGGFFEALMGALDEEQGSKPEDREGIEIVVTGTDF